LFGGFYAIIAAVNGNFSRAGIAIFIAMLFDGLDGRVARWTNTQSDFGKEYDSLDLSAAVRDLTVVLGVVAHDLGQWQAGDDDDDAGRERRRAQHSDRDLSKIDEIFEGPRLP
jgi:hypothetical protein